MHYFYDHQTDELSILVSDFETYAASRPVVPGVIVHLDARRQALGMEIGRARAIVNVAGLMSFEQAPIAPSELEQRMNASESGRRAWRALTGDVAPPLHVVRAS
ncbi:MAG TPA: DUF2283 domain-containing protein [Thermoanaerobaculia bacterium]|jgi:hypothetical protein|nr:DUF2283 domain-containing protein [Thermoanaerobaculia bacterium]